MTDWWKIELAAWALIAYVVLLVVLALAPD